MTNFYQVQKKKKKQRQKKDFQNMIKSKETAHICLEAEVQ
jgi:hypothetical protein